MGCFGVPRVSIHGGKYGEQPAPATELGRGLEVQRELLGPARLGWEQRNPPMEEGKITAWRREGFGEGMGDEESNG